MQHRQLASSAAGVSPPAPAWLSRGLAVNAAGLRLLSKLSWPALDLGLRVWLARSFFVFGLIKVTHWQTARYLAAHEYPVSWLDPATSAYTGAAIEIIAPIFLVLGVLTRYAAPPLLILTLVIQFSYRAFDTQLCWAVLFGWYVVHGAGPWSFDQPLLHGGGPVALDPVIAGWIRQRFPALAGKPAFALDGLPRVVIVGAGFAGLSCAVALRHARVAVTLIDRAYHHLFQPLLYQVATAAISPSDIAAPIRSLFRDAFNTRVLLGTVTAIDARANRADRPAASAVRLSSARDRRCA